MVAPLIRKPALTRRTLLLACLSMFLGCAERSTEDLGNDGSVGADSAPTRDRTAELVERHTIGPGDGEAAQFGYVRDVARGADGRLYVLDALAKEVRVFERDGSHALTVGRPGSGPGEFRGPVALEISGDTLWVWDQGLWRLTAFGVAGGAVLESHEIPPVALSGWSVDFQRLASGVWLHLTQEVRPGESPPQPNTIIRAHAEFQTWEPGDGSWDPVVEVPGSEAAISPSGRGLTQPPFPARALWAVGPETAFWYADSDRYRITLMGLDGDSLAVIDVPQNGPEVTATDVERFLAPPDVVDENRRRELRERRRQLAMPDRKPVLTKLVPAANGGVWVALQPSTEGQQTWHVYSRRGGPRFELVLPTNATVVDVLADTVVTVNTDSLDVQRVAELVLTTS